MLFPSFLTLSRGVTVIPSFATSIFAFILHCSLPGSRVDLLSTKASSSGGMDAKCKLWDGSNLDHIKEAAAALRSGQPVAFPTETVYGLGAIASDDEAVGRVFLAKGRPSDNPLIVHVADGEAGLKRLCLNGDPPEIALRLGRRFWPGPLSICVLANKDAVGAKTRAGLNTVAVSRCPSVQSIRSFAALSQPHLASAKRSPPTPPSTCTQRTLQPALPPQAGVRCLALRSPGQAAPSRASSPAPPPRTCAAAHVRRRVLPSPASPAPLRLLRRHGADAAEALLREPGTTARPEEARQTRNALPTRADSPRRWLC
jgi:tRNA threonylcarbamoyl adenosine modification protein (Sua5/YciO/YrdC/YwlC family)